MNELMPSAVQVQIDKQRKPSAISVNGSAQAPSLSGPWSFIVKTMREASQGAFDSMLASIVMNPREPHMDDSKILSRLKG